MRIAIVGNSPLAFFVAQGLNNDIARYAHLEVVWLTADRDLSFLTTQKLLSPNRTVKKSVALGNIRLVTDRIRSVSLTARRIVTDKKLIEFDLLFLDQTPWYTQADLAEVAQALQRLIVQLRTRKDIRADGAIRLKGQSPLAWQLGLAIQSELHRLKNRTVVVEIERPKQRVVAEFLKEMGLMLEFSSRPGFTIGAPEPAFASRRVKGIRIDRRERAVTDAAGLAAREVLVAEHAASADRTLLRALEVEARLYTAQIERLITRGELIDLEREPAAYLLRHERRLLLRLERLTSQRVRARLVFKLDHDLWKKLVSRHG